MSSNYSSERAGAKGTPRKMGKGEKSKNKK